LASHRFYHGKILDPDTREIIDEVLVVAMLAPRSYTREDVVEIHSHSGFVVMGKIYEKVLDAGATMAEPGEFTRRAFLNGRIDLPQAEAVVDIINAKTDTALLIANRQLAGGLTEKLAGIRASLLEICAAFELSIDFSDHAQDDIQVGSMLRQLDRDVLQKIERLICDYDQYHFFRDGVKMAVIGRPNVGKSSLMNCLVQRDRAIVTAVPGTTRDVIEETLHINGLPVVVMDTAGLHEAQGEIERMGIEKTRQSIHSADIVLFLVDNSVPLQLDDYAIYREIADKKHLIVKNKIDLPSEHSCSNLSDAWRSAPCIEISALKGTHIDELKRMIWKMVVGCTGSLQEVGLVPNLRHKRGLAACLLCCKRAMKAMSNGLPGEMVTMDIMDAVHRLDSLLGDECRPDILDQVFNRFCIGK
jgi:tRNA modification GTPase